MKKNPKIVVIGGGTGTYQVLVGLKKHPVELSAIVSMSDSGGSSGRLREELGILPLGDARRALLALSDLPLAKDTLSSLFSYRFNGNGHSSKKDSSSEDNSGLIGHNFGNLFLAALTQITGRADLAIAEAGRILEIAGRVLPVTLDQTQLHGRLADGTVIHGETNLDVRSTKPEIPLVEVFLEPGGKIFDGAKKAILESDLIVLAPGDLYTSLIPNLLVDGVIKAVAQAKARVICTCNLMTKPGETDGFYASDFVSEIQKYLGDASPKLSHVLVNKELKLAGNVASWYKKHEAHPVMVDEDKMKNVKVVTGSFADRGKLIRHDPDRLAKAILKLI